MQIKIVNREKEPLFLDDVKKAIAALPEKGGVWDVENPQNVVVALENICAKLNDTLELQMAHDKESICNVGVEYEAEETDMLCRLDDLFEKWKSKLSGDEIKLFNRDGFYPGYSHQKVRILFVGREACYMAGRNYIEYMYNSFKSSYIGKWTVNQYPFHRRQAYVAYGILKSLGGGSEWHWPCWDVVPVAADICKDVGKEDKYSWAFINLSKLSNETGDYRTDGNRYWPFVNSKENQCWLIKQISILNPDIIIGANVPELADILCYGKPDTSNGNCYAYYKKGLPLFLNCYHFAAIKGDRKFFYEPVGKVLGNKLFELKEAIENRDHRKTDGYGNEAVVRRRGLLEALSQKMNWPDGSFRYYSADGKRISIGMLHDPDTDWFVWHWVSVLKEYGHFAIELCIDRQCCHYEVGISRLTVGDTETLDAKIADCLRGIDDKSWAFLKDDLCWHVVHRDAIPAAMTNTEVVGVLASRLCALQQVVQ